MIGAEAAYAAAMLARSRLATLGLFCLATLAGACAPSSQGADGEDGEDGASEESFLKNVEKTGSKSQKWIYEGWLPAFEKPSVFVSLKGHTARVTGLLPAGFTGELPFYAKTSPTLDGGTKITVVYPIATGAVDPSTGKAPAGPGVYPFLTAIPFTATNDKAAWGGFPFLKYHQSRGLAFHGPITSQRNADTGDWEWLLKRGPVSHGCNRMQGEHVVELTHILGLDMSAPHASGEVAKLSTSVEVSREWDTFEGHYVDVDYPALAAVQRPTTNVEMFQTWDSRNLPQVVCSFDKSLPEDGAQCANAGQILQDLATGEMFDLPEAPKAAWIGSTCSADSECGFTSDGEKGFCLRDGEGADAPGFCTVSCEGYCEDLAGHSETFCATTREGDGTCMAKAAVENSGCTSIDGTDAQPRERFIGTSSASEKVATVCTF